MRTADLDYHLPDELVATTPADPRDSARLMVVRRAADTVEHRRVRDLPDIEDGPAAGDLLVLNDTRVLPAYFHAVRDATGGKVTGLYLADAPDNAWRIMLESRGKLQPGEVIRLDDDATLTLMQRIEAGQWLARLDSAADSPTTLQRVGATPLPPYIRKHRKQQGRDEVTDDDAERYNTVYARDAGSVAAPTAGLHFTPKLLADLEARGVRIARVTLHVGLGTFAPVRAQRLEDHHIHRERIIVPADTIDAVRQTRDAGGRIIPVGTTTVRALESLPQHLDASRDYTADTSLFITPGPDGQTAWPYRFTDALLTNFHLPQSTLLALVAALPDVGVARLRDWYQQAVDQRYRFYSYGDAMLLT